jgi:predicted DNA-binding WGR domain protein
MDQQIKHPDVLNVLVLERVDRTKNMARYYVLSVEPTLFAESSLVRRWGRIGGAGRTRVDLHASPPLAQIALNTWLERKRRRGYRLLIAGSWLCAGVGGFIRYSFDRTALATLRPRDKRSTHRFGSQGGGNEPS